jgi:hypothetical protein
MWYSSYLRVRAMGVWGVCSRYSFVSVLCRTTCERQIWQSASPRWGKAPQALAAILQMLVLPDVQWASAAVQLCVRPVAHYLRAPDLAVSPHDEGHPATP